MYPVLDRRVQLHFIILTSQVSSDNKQIVPSKESPISSCSPPLWGRWWPHSLSVERKNAWFTQREFTWLCAERDYLSETRFLWNENGCAHAFAMLWKHKYSTGSDSSPETVRFRGWHCFLTIFESFSEAELCKLQVNHPTPQLLGDGYIRALEKCALGRKRPTEQHKQTNQLVIMG